MSRLYVYADTLARGREYLRDHDVAGTRTPVVVTRRGGGHRLIASSIALGDRVLLVDRPQPKAVVELLVALTPLPAVSTTQAADLLNVPAGVIANWKNRRVVVPIDFLPGGRGVRGGNGTPLYRATELLGPTIRYHFGGRR